LFGRKQGYYVKEIYSITTKFPVSENFTLTNQIRRSAISISNNICEGAGRNSNKDFI
jgi:four helix bundle protein